MLHRYPKIAGKPYLSAGSNIFAVCHTLPPFPSVIFTTAAIQLSWCGCNHFGDATGMILGAVLP
jgi:hypothetical protein